MRTLLRWGVAPLAVLALAACGGREDAAAPGEPAKTSDATLAAALNDDGDLDELESVVRASALDPVLQGVGPYTVFAPTDAAFAAGGGAAEFTGETQKAEAAALLRAHIVPGALTRADIGAAIDRGGKGVEMRTMAGGLLTFSREGQAIVVTAPDGAKARLAEDEAVVRNGVIQPVDALLVRPAPASAPTTAPGTTPASAPAPAKAPAY
jgi:uncharacterized surface protein with fasciclin (FAS1) repeats